jgi:hypothetical protein
MVGFGSSLRMARRPGWEGAYLDYETLKLFLSQIDAVYEEEGHGYRQREAQQGWEGGDPDRVKKRKTGDYKDELFLEEDSDEAFLSVDDEEDDDEFSEESEMEKVAAAKSPGREPFTLSYSHHASSSEGEDSGEKECVPFLPVWKTGSGQAKKPLKRRGSGGKKPSKRRSRKSSGIPMDEEDRFYNVKSGSVGSGSNTFFLSSQDEEMASGQPQSVDSTSKMGQQSGSILNAPVRRTFAHESTALLPSAAPVTPGSSLVTFSSGVGESLTPPHPGFAPGPRYSRSHQQKESGKFSADSSSYGKDSSSPSTTTGQQQKVDEAERNRERRRRRSQQKRLRAIREQRERKVPRHIRVAHAKARAITERFLGLLRAETEKVSLFAQSRLGELADTAGSLRFPSFDDEYGGTANGLRSGETYQYNPLSDGGMHPSASSSSEDGSRDNIFSSWLDSSDSEKEGDDVKKSGGDSSGRSTSRKRSTQPGLSDSGTDHRMRANSSDEQLSSIGYNVTERENMQAVQRQIAHFEQLRKRRHLFQRNDQILGEDMLFLSAVEEADGYTAVGVELMHVLKYICVNLIAVRKICRKHDRLLMNRMLGGYYQRARNQTRQMVREGHDSHNFEDIFTLGGRLARVSGDIYEAHPALVEQTNHYKLVGVYDRKIQKLANSRTVQVISSCLGRALSEYEVARSRADALTRLNSAASLETPKASTSRKSKFGFAGILQPSLDSDDDLGEGPPSTASNISLTRLQFTVTSIFALREAARRKLDSYMVYLARTMLTFTGQQVVGEGLDGCSRETLDFIVLYKPDAALLLDSAILFEGLKHGRWTRLPMGDVMVSTLAVATLPLNVSHDVATSLLTHEETAVANSVSIVPESKSVMLKRLIRGQVPRSVTKHRILAIEDFPPMALGISRMSAFLYMVSWIGRIWEAF